ncbi:hypothetical protein BKA66DRAFT_574275 [Pyrenochaeta sp. MPI-SDFR-AT-0127]|nr:hypothetical protein BKA66DRAFT_574275 [Pyrenochaeta sp. MPI-SDFR-AT-0127]
MTLDMGKNVRSGVSGANSSSSNSALLSSFWPDLFASDRQLSAAQKAYMGEVEQHALPQYSPSGQALVLEENIQYADEMLIDDFSDSIRINGEEEMMDIDEVDFEMEQFLKFEGEIITYFPVADTEQKKHADPLGSSVDKDDSLGKTKQSTENSHTNKIQAPEFEEIEQKSTDGSSLTFLSDVSALNPEKLDKPVRPKRNTDTSRSTLTVVSNVSALNPEGKCTSVGLNQNADTSGSSLTSMSDASTLNPEGTGKSIMPKRNAGTPAVRKVNRQPTRVSRLQPLANLKRYESMGYGQSMQKRAHINWWLNHIDPQSPP